MRNLGLGRGLGKKGRDGEKAGREDKRGGEREGYGSKERRDGEMKKVGK